jgi:hypothetical protein
MIGVIFLAFFFGAYAIESSIVYSAGSVAIGALAYWLGHAVIWIVPWIYENAFSFFALPTKTHLSVLDTLPGFLRQFVNNVLAPGENFLIFAFVALIYKTLDEAGFPLPVSVGAAVVSGAAVFSRLHSGRPTAFHIFAFVVMAVWIAVVLLVDLDVVSISAVVITVMFTFGMHQQINMQQTGGMRQFLETIWHAPPPYALLGKAYVAWTVVTFLLAVIGAYVYYDEYVPRIGVLDAIAEIVHD